MATRGNLNQEGTKSKRSRPPLFASDEKANEHDAGHVDRVVEEERPESSSGIPHIFELILPLSVCIGGVTLASMYGIRWLLTLSCVLAAASVVIYFINSRRRARQRLLSDAETIEQEVAEYRRDLMKTLEGYDVDRGMSQEEIDALVQEYRHHLAVENASLANVNFFALIAALFRRNRDEDGEGDGKRKGRKAKKAEKKTGRGGLSDGE